MGDLGFGDLELRDLRCRISELSIASFIRVQDLGCGVTSGFGFRDRELVVRLWVSGLS